MFLYKRPGNLSGLLFLLLAACGGGDSGQPVNLASSGQQTTTQQDSTQPTVMNCVDGGTEHCTGNTILRVDNGVAVTASSVQTYGVSTNDLASPNPAPAQAYGMKLATGGLAEVRVKRNDSGVVESVALLLSKLGISWDGTQDRPLIIETFETRMGRTVIDDKGKISFITLPPTTDLDFYDYAKKGAAGTQSHYANNTYFPRSEPVRCPTNYPNCPTVESTGLQHEAGDWKTGGSIPDGTSASRLHSDGATQAGWGVDATGKLVLLSSADGPGVSYPGFKGFRNYANWSYGYANLGGWITQDTVLINEWGGNDEHNKMRRGIVAFGPVTTPSQVPTTGTARYSGVLRGWFGYDGVNDVYPTVGMVMMTVDFATRNVTIQITGTRIDEGTMDTVPVALTAGATIGSADFANYFNGTADNGTLKGGLGARFFGPVTSGGSGTAPAEIGGSMTIQNSGTGMIAVTGFILRKQ
jgi:hypothetical protein